jgi:signal transduction histidine kinase
MRRTIQRQFRDPVLLVVSAVVLAITLATATWQAGIAWRQEQRQLDRVLSTLATPRFPLHRTVLDQISGLSGAQLAVVEAAEITETTVPLTPDDRVRLFEWLKQSDEAEASPGRESLDLSTGPFLVDRIALRTAAAGEPAGPQYLAVLSPEPDWWSIWRGAAVGPLVVGGLGCLPLLAIIAWRSRQVVRPLGKLQEQASAIAGGEFRVVELPPRDDEVRDLAAAINQMVDRLMRFEQQVRRQERLQTLAQLTGGMAHHLRNAATGGRLALELHRRRSKAAEHDDDLSVALRQFTQIEQYLQRLLLSSRAEPSLDRPREHVDLAELLRQVVEFLTPLCKHAKVRLDAEIAGQSAVVSGCRDALEQIVVNLALNGLEAVKAQPPELRRLAVDLARSGDSARLTIRDWGPGPKAGIAPAMFEPFESDKPDGAGLGLSVARQVTLQHGGEIDWTRDADTTLFSVKLPCVCEVPYGALAGG